jgi:carbon-monoxide dehydrogenase large subunit
MTTKAFGASIKRKEDPRLITGEAKYLEDLQMPGLLHAAILRSPYAHAKIKSINTKKATAHPGVIGVFTGQDFMNLNPMPAAWVVTGATVHANTPRCLEPEKVTHVGQGVAVVVAEDRYTAEDALQLIDVSWEP